MSRGRRFSLGSARLTRIQYGLQMAGRAHVTNRMCSSPKNTPETGARPQDAADQPNETKEGRAENRRVEVKILVNKGIAGS